jgi:spore germination protein KA
MRYLNKGKADTKPQLPNRVSAALSVNIQENIEQLRALLNACSDVVIREFTFGRQQETRCVLLYFDGLVDRTEIEENLLKPMLLEINMLEKESHPLEQKALLQQIQEHILSLAEVKPVSTLEEICHHICSGDTVLLVDGNQKGLAAGTRSWHTRAIQTPENESTIQGPKEGFNETLRLNTALLRRRLKSTQLKIESLLIGRISQTDTAVCYLEDIAPAGLVDEVKDRLSGIDIDGVLDTGYLEEFLENTKWTIFSQVEYTEKPDRVCGHLLEGRVCIMVDGSPMALIVPTSFPQFLITGEDYYQRFVPASLFRIMRFIAFFIALLLPSLYVAIISYHQEVVPSSLYLTIASSREGVPFPAFVEALIMESVFELLREAGLRLPRAIGPAVSIVGALIIGDAAVKAGLVSTPMVVVVAFTGIASFISPAYNAGTIIRIARFGILFASGLLGFFGILISLLMMLIRMASLSSLGQPYLSPVAPFDRAQISDILLRRPWTMNTNRPYMDRMQNRSRQKKASNNNGG